MKPDEINKYVGKVVSLVIPMHRRISMATFGDLMTDRDPLTGEAMYSVSSGEVVIRFPLNDIHSVEVSERKGIVVRLTN